MRKFFLLVVVSVIYGFSVMNTVAEFINNPIMALAFTLLLIGLYGNMIKVISRGD